MCVCHAFRTMHQCKIRKWDPFWHCMNQSSSLHFLPQSYPRYSTQATLRYARYARYGCHGCAPEWPFAVCVLAQAGTGKTQAPMEAIFHWQVSIFAAIPNTLRMHGCARVALRWSPKVVGELHRLYFTTTFHYQVFIFCRNLTLPRRFTLMQGTHSHQMWL